MVTFVILGIVLSTPLPLMADRMREPVSTRLSFGAGSPSSASTAGGP